MKRAGELARGGTHATPCAFVVIVAALAWARDSHADYRYKILRLDGLPTLDGTPTDPGAAAIDEKGMVVGTSRRSGGGWGSTAPHRVDAVRWDPGSTTPVMLQHSVDRPEMFATTAGIDATGAIYGSLLWDGSEGYKPVRWPAGSTLPQFLPISRTPSGAPISSRIYAAGPDGTAAGESGFQRATVWRPGADAPIDVLQGRGFGANASGVVVGEEIGVGAFRLDPGATAPVRLGPGTMAEDINDAGAIVGAHAIGASPNLIVNAVMWEPGSTSPTLLPSLNRPPPSPNHSSARDINNVGVILGTASGELVIWEARTRRVIPLENLFDDGGKWLIRTVAAINDKGQIVGTGLYHRDGLGVGQGDPASFVLNPDWAADANSDFVVNFKDFQILEGNFGQDVSGLDSAVAKSRGDFNADGWVNHSDFGILRGEFGRIAGVPGAAAADLPQLSVPEPAGAALACGICVALAIRARRARRP